MASKIPNPKNRPMTKYATIAAKNFMARCYLMGAGFQAAKCRA
jgi:hypothetical protein